MTEIDAKRSLSALVFADVVGYSRMMGEDDSGTLAEMRRRRVKLVDPLVAAFHGRLVNAAGDSLLIEFSSVVLAAQFAISLQQRNAELDAEAKTPFRFRLGVNLGEVLARDGAVFGDSVNIAARLQGLAEPGGLCLSGAAFDQVRGKIDAEFADLGPQKVKNIARPIEVFSLSAAAIAAAPRVSPPPRRSFRRLRAAGLIVLALIALGAGGFWLQFSERAAFAGALDRALASHQPTLSANARAKLVADYIAVRAHRAFVLAPNAQDHWWTGDWPSPEVAQEKARERCEIAFREPCRILAIDETLSAEEAPRAAPRVEYEGAFEADKIPAIRAASLQRRDVLDYATAKGPKAIALHPRGVLAVALSADSQRKAELQALKACNDDDQSRDADGPCFLYASGDKVILPRRLTTALTPKP